MNVVNKKRAATALAIASVVVAVYLANVMFMMSCEGLNAVERHAYFEIVLSGSAIVNVYPFCPTLLWYWPAVLVIAATAIIIAIFAKIVKAGWFACALLWLLMAPVFCAYGYWSGNSHTDFDKIGLQYYFSLVLMIYSMVMSSISCIVYICRMKKSEVDIAAKPHSARGESVAKSDRVEAKP